ncbi:hypothetical protein DFJ77DRAFT_127330 [Powellomyces hirtus]|nr:hypothetical protein DFJ77DRAFT_127330 [Powellomyces hirtus]
MSAIQQTAAEVARNYLIWRSQRPAVSRPNGGPTRQRLRDQATFLSKLRGTIDQFAEYDKIELQDVAREAIPIDRLHSEAHAQVEANPKTQFHDHLVKALLRWFKNEYFTWVNSPPCQHCQSPTTAVGGVNPTPEEIRYQCGRVELYKCNLCHKETRFPRYNNLRKLMETRRGRCGEWANVFCLFCKTMGFETRYVLDFTDHVWTEIYKDGKGWVNCDSCEGEGSYDQPLMYEAGWGKKLTYIFSIGTYEIVDVIRRYTNKPDEVFARRTDVDELWLKQTISDLTARMQNTLPASAKSDLEQRAAQEQAQLNKTIAKEDEGPVAAVLHGRESGSVQWRAARGELGANQAPADETSDVKKNATS